MDLNSSFSNNEKLGVGCKKPPNVISSCLKSLCVFYGTINYIPLKKNYLGPV